MSECVSCCYLFNLLRNPHKKSTQHNAVSIPDVPTTSLFCILSLRSSQAYLQAVSDLNNLVTSRMKNVFLHNDIIYNLTSHSRRTNSACQIAHEHTGCVFSFLSAPLTGSA